MTSKLLQEILIPVYGDIRIINFTEAFSFEGLHFDYYYTNDDRVILSDSVNIYELAHMCKEWVYKVTSTNGSEGYFVMSTNKHNIVGNKALAWVAPSYERSTDTAYIDYQVEDDTEPEAIFKACEWVLENLNSLID